MYAPDDVDGKIYIYSPIELEIGQIVNVEIIDVDHDKQRISLSLKNTEPDHHMI
mgnify:CR=1 FL=1